MAGTTPSGYPIAPTAAERERQLRLHRIAAHGTGRDVRNALMDGAEANTADANGKTALHIAAGSGRVDIVRELLGHCDVTLRDTSGCTALIDAIRPAAKGNRNAMLTVHALLEAGSDINAADTDGFAVLMAASFHAMGTYDFCEVLIECGADPKASDAFGWNAMHWACQNPDARQAAVVGALAKAGCWVNQPAVMGGNSPLHLAVIHGCPIEVIDALLAVGADPLLTNTSGRTPAGLATEEAKKGNVSAGVAERLQKALSQAQPRRAASNGLDQNG